MNGDNPENSTQNTDFIREEIKKDMNEERFAPPVHTRFPPEPNGYLHLGHAKAMSISYGIAEDFDGLFNLRFDDTNPFTEKSEYVDAAKRDITWLGYEWENREYYASDYFEQLYEWAVALIKKGKAYVCDLTEDEIREYRGTAVFGHNGKRETPPGTDSPCRNRSAEENLDLFEGMKNGEFPDGSRTLRAKIDMAHPNLNMRDPVMYRIIHASHYRRGDEWCIYPTYDWAHGQSDSIEEITHSLCDVGFKNHRPLYNWFLENLNVYSPRQIEFGRFNMTYTVMSKRILRELIDEGHILGWDDPRLPTLCGMRRRGYTPESIRDFCSRTGISNTNSTIEIELLEHCVRQHLNKTAPRVLCVLDPLKVVITNYPEEKEEELEAVNNPEDEKAGTRMVPFSREIWIERQDFMEDPPRKFYRLAPGREVRLRYAYFMTCEQVIKDKNGTVTELRCSIDHATRGGDAPDGRKVKGTLHWVSAAHAVTGEIRLYNRLFTEENPLDVKEGQDWKECINPDSLNVLDSCFLEPGLEQKDSGYICQFERKGYFCKDPDSTPEHPVFNQTVPLRDSWAKMRKKKNK